MGTFKRRFSRRPLALTPETGERWLVRSRPPVSLLEARPPGSSWPPRQPGSQHHPQEEGRSHIGTGPAQLPCVRSGVTRSRQSCSSASCPTCAPSTPSVSPSCPRTSSWPGGSVASVHKNLDQSGSIRESLTTLGTPCGQSVTAPLQRLCSLKFSNPCALTFLSVCHSTQTHDQMRDIVKVL